MFRFPFTAMASSCEVRLDGIDRIEAERLARLACDEVRRIEHTYSRYRAGSIVSRINAAAGGAAVACDMETLSLLAYADALYKDSAGLFDITSGVLRRAWNFNEARLPKPVQLAELLTLVGWEDVELDRTSVRLPRAGMEIDFGGFGKEYAADRAAALLMSYGAKHGYVNLGGDMRIVGPRADGSAWTIGIQDPRDADGIAAGIDVSSGALATSGDYERFIEVEGVRYCHILHPRTGMPVSHWRSVSVLGPLAVAAGSCSTIAMLMQDAALTYLDHIGVAYLAIDASGQTFRRDL